MTEHGPTPNPDGQPSPAPTATGALAQRVVHRLTPDGVERIGTGFRTRCTCGWVHVVIGSETDARRAYHAHQFGPESVQATRTTARTHSQQAFAPKRPMSAWKIALVLTPVLLLFSQCGGDADPGGEIVECLDSAALVLEETGFDLSSGCR